MKTITIRLSDVEAVMLVEVRKWHKKSGGMDDFFKQIIVKEYNELGFNRRVGS